MNKREIVYTCPYCERELLLNENNILCKTETVFLGEVINLIGRSCFNEDHYYSTCSKCNKTFKICSTQISPELAQSIKAAKKA